MVKSLLDRVRERGRVQTVFVGETLTKASFKDSVDVNRIMASYKKTGLISQSMQATYADLVDGPQDYQEALERVRSADAAFASMPAKVRDRFGNDPGHLLAFLADPSNADEAMKLGLVEKPVVTPVAVPPAVGGEKP